MRVCLVSVEIFAWGKYSDFGRATAGYEYVKQVFSLDKAIDQHLTIYERVISFQNMVENYPEGHSGENRMHR